MADARKHRPRPTPRRHAATPSVYRASADALTRPPPGLQAGSANTSTTRRPLLYQVYGRSWYDEALQNRLNEDLGLARRGVRAEWLFPQRGADGEPPFSSLR